MSSTPFPRPDWQHSWQAQPRRAMLFDLDGTLLDSAPDLAHVANVLREQRGMPPMAVNELRPWVSQGARGMITRGLGIGTDHPEFEHARKTFMEVYAECLSRHTTWWPGMDAVVEALEANHIAWGIVTNKIARFTEPLLKDIDLYHRCAVVVSGDTTPHAKPHPAPVAHAISSLNLPPQAVVYVGDDLRDIESGFAAGTWTIGCDFGHHVQEPLPPQWGADALIQKAEDLLAVIAKS
ncbi:MAG: HAD-IA family hydrolase [Burkholderiaceae bacterium]|nr:HAD-IA family hydrolase [Burkholderiaceae bacterium]